MKGAKTMYNYNPYTNYGQVNPYNQNQPTQVIKVHGDEGAKAYNNMMPNSSVLLLDETLPRVFLKTTDGANFPSITAYKLEPWIEEKPIDYNNLEERISKIEEIINAKSNTTKAKSKSESEQ